MRALTVLTATSVQSLTHSGSSSTVHVDAAHVPFDFDGAGTAFGSKDVLSECTPIVQELSLIRRTDRVPIYVPLLAVTRFCDLTPRHGSNRKAFHVFRWLYLRIVPILEDVNTASTKLWIDAGVGGTLSNETWLEQLFTTLVRTTNKKMFSAGRPQAFSNLFLDGLDFGSRQQRYLQKRQSSGYHPRNKALGQLNPLSPYSTPSTSRNISPPGATQTGLLHATQHIPSSHTIPTGV